MLVIYMTDVDFCRFLVHRYNHNTFPESSAQRPFREFTLGRSISASLTVSGQSSQRGCAHSLARCGDGATPLPASWRLTSPPLGPRRRRRATQKGNRGSLVAGHQSEE